MPKKTKKIIIYGKYWMKNAYCDGNMGINTLFLCQVKQFNIKFND